MATSQQMTENVLKCALCSEVFVNPCTLVCNHTFCRNCVVNYTQARPEAINAKSLICPFCNMMTKVPEPPRSVEELVEDMKPCVVELGLRVSLGPHTMETTSCVDCKERGETTPGHDTCSVCDEALCEECVLNHDCIQQVTDQHTEVEDKTKPDAMCNVHPQECIEFLCKDCRKTICNKCRLYHATCDSVFKIESQIEPMRRELRKRKEALSKKPDDMKSKTDELISTLNTETSRYKQMEETIISLTQKVIEEIKVKERRLLADLKELSESHIRQLKAHIKSRELTAQACQEEAELIDEALLSECDKSLYEMYEGCETDDVDAMGETIPMSKKGRIAKVTFTQSKCLQDSETLSKALEDLKLGEIDVFYDGVVNLSVDPVLYDTIDVRIPENRNKGWVADVTVMMIDGIKTIVVTDRNNNNLNSFFTKNNQLCHSRLTLCHAPWSLTKTVHNPLAVTVPGMKQIITVKVSPQLYLLSTIKTSKQYWGITYLKPSLLAVGSKFPPSIDILDMTGNMLHSISLSLSSRDVLLQCPNYLCTTRKGNILVSDGGSKSVLCLTPEGEIVFSYRPTGEAALKCPQGIISTCRGDILVTDFTLHKVIHLNEAGKFVRNVLVYGDGIEKPLGVDVDGSSQLYLCLQNQDVIKIFIC